MLYTSMPKQLKIAFPSLGTRKTLAKPFPSRNLKLPAIIGAAIEVSKHTLRNEVDRD